MQQGIGMGRLKGWTGTQNTERMAGKAGLHQNAFALFADRLINRFSQAKRNIAQKNAHESNIIKASARNLIANVAEMLLIITNTRSNRIAPTSVQTHRANLTRVYNLTLEHENVYYANGVLVSNCADAFVLTFAEEATVGAFGSAAKNGWSKPLRRNVPRLA